VFASHLNRIENSLQRGLNDLKNTPVFKRFHNEPDEKYPFRRLTHPVFQQQATYDEAPVYDVPHQPVQPLPQEYTPTPTPVATPLFDLPLANRVIAMEWQRRQQHLVSHINASQPSGCHVMAYPILPHEVFSGDIGRFLTMACDFYSHGFANTLLLPAMLAGVEYFKLPQHPHTPPEVQTSESQARILQLRTRVANEHNRVAAALARGDVELLFKKNNNRPDYKQELASICRSIAIKSLGLSAFVTHESRFGSELRDAVV
jgi:hypothetical protein